MFRPPEEDRSVLRVNPTPDPLENPAAAAVGAGDAAETGRRSLRPLLALLPYIVRHPKTLAAAGVALVVSALAMLSIPLAVRRMIDLGFGGGDDMLIANYFAMNNDISTQDNNITFDFAALFHGEVAAEDDDSAFNCVIFGQG